MNGLKNLVFIKNLYLPPSDLNQLCIHTIIYSFPPVSRAFRIYQCLAVDQEAAHRCVATWVAGIWPIYVNEYLFI